MTVSPEHGKRYNTRAGQVTDAITESVKGGFFSSVAGCIHYWRQNGASERGASLDLISEYIEPTEEPAWIEWHGGECPIKSYNTRVEAKLFDGDTALRKGVKLDWSHDAPNNDGDIIAYRITENHEPAETALIDMSQNRVPWEMLTDEEQAAFSAWRAGGGAVERWWTEGWEPVSQSFDLGGMMICRTVSPPVITELTYERHMGGHLCKITLTYHDGKPISGTVVV